MQEEREATTAASVGTAPIRHGRWSLLAIDRFTAGISLAAIALVLGALIAVSRQAGQAPPPDESSPRGVVYGYFQALSEGDTARAYGSLSAQAQSKTPYEQFVATHSRGSDRAMIRLDDERVEGDTARVTLRTTHSGHGFPPFLSEAYSSTRPVVLRQEGGSWKLTQPEMVW